MHKLKFKIISKLLKNSEVLLIEYNQNKGFAILVEEDTHDFLRRVALETMENKPFVKDFFLAVTERYLKAHADERLKFSKSVYNQ